ncbi:MAG: hypothetical protein GY765_12805, partial [bacterium]|nr:hypothetical protein [bacterium]
TPAQYIHNYNDSTLDYFDFSGRDSEERLSRWGEETCRKPFQFLDGRLFYFALIKINEKESGYYLNLHQIVADGGTTSVVMSEINRIYRALSTGTQSDTGEAPKPSYIRYLADAEDYLKSPRASLDRDFWYEKIFPLPEEWTLSTKLYDSTKIKTRTLESSFPEDISIAMLEFCKKHNATVYKLIFSTLALYISRLACLDDLFIGSVTHGRFSKSHRDMTGDFINFLPIRVKIDETMDFPGFIREEVSTGIFQSLRHHKYPFPVLAAEIRENTGADIRYLLDINLVEDQVLKEKEFSLQRFYPGEDPIPLSIHINPNKRERFDNIELGWIYQVERFSETDIARIHQGMTNILANLFSNPTATLAELEPFSEKEKEEILRELVDNRVSINGTRIDTDEIESCLLKLDFIEQAALVVRKEPPGGKDLCAFIVSPQRQVESALKESLAGCFPSCPIPGYFVQLEEIPCIADGTVDKKLLKKIATTAGQKEFDTPRNKLEELLLEIWQDVLGSKTIGINDNFFMIGGDSIRTIQIASRLNKIGYKVEMQDIFRNPTISKLAPYLKKKERIAGQSQVHGAIPLTPVQSAFFAEVKTQPSHYNQSVMFSSRERLDEEGLQIVFSQLQEHHDALRMTYKKVEGKIIQTCHKVESYPLSLQVYDFRNGNADTDEGEQIEARANEIQASIDLEKGPLMKPALFRLESGDRLLIALHHLVIDAVSWRILFEDIETLYRRFKENTDTPLPLKTDSFKLWSEKLSLYADSEEFLKDKKYWRHLEASMEAGPISQIEPDTNESSNFVKDTLQLSFSLNKADTARLLTKVNKAFNTELNDILLTALAMGMKKACGLDRVLITLEGHGRERILDDIDISRTVGWFTTAFPVLLDCSHITAEASPGMLSRQIKEIKETLRRIPGKGIGYGILKYLTSEENKKDINFSTRPGILFNYLGQFGNEIQQMSFEIAKESAGHSLSMDGERQFELDVSGMIADKQLVMNIGYNGKRFRADTIRKMLDCFREELVAIISFCSAREETELTPGDLTYKELPIEVLDRLNTEYPVEDIYTLTPMQEGMLFHSLYDDSSAAYCIQSSYRLNGKWHIDVLEKTLKELVQRYAILRTAFVHNHFERPLQVVLKERQPDFLYEDLQDTDGENACKAEYVREYKEKDRERVFVPGKDVLMRMAVFRTAPMEYELIWSLHHILMDGWCIGILISEFLEIYNSFLENRDYRLPGVIPYRNYIEWLEKQDKLSSKNFWKKYLAGYDTLASIPKKNTNAADEQTFDNRNVDCTLDSEATDKLNRLAAEKQVTVNLIMQAVWGLILGNYSGKKDVVFGSVVSGRPSEIDGVESIVGLFINTIPVRVNYTETAQFSQLLESIKENAITSEPHHYYPLANIQSDSILKRNLLDHILVFENFPVAADMLKGKTNGNKDEATLGIAGGDSDVFTNYEFYITIVPGEQLGIRLKYNAVVYDRELIERIKDHFYDLLARVIADDDIVLEEFKLLSAEARQVALEDFNDDLEDEFD